MSSDAGRAEEVSAIATLSIGPWLRAARESLDLSLRALAERTGFSASFLSQVELGQSSPSLASLQRMCAALDVELVDLLRDASRPRAAPILRRQEREPLRSEWSHASAESILPAGADDMLRATLLTLEREGKTGRIERRRGSREFAPSIRGQVTLLAENERHELHEGDTVLLDDMPATAWENTGECVAEILLVLREVEVGPPRLRSGLWSHRSRGALVHLRVSSNIALVFSIAGHEEGPSWQDSLEKNNVQGYLCAVIPAEGGPWRPRI